MKKLISVCLLVFALGIEWSHSENKIALIIANGNYRDLSGLSGPIPEGENLGATLASIGFDVKIIRNATREQMLESIDKLRTRLAGKGGVVFFHYGGHGIQYEGRNYLIPTDAVLPDESKLKTRAVDLDEVTSSIESCGSSTNIVVIDACRNNPLRGSSSRSTNRGLQVVTQPPRNSIIVYSAETGTVAKDGLFTPALTEALKTPGLTLTELLMHVRKVVYSASEGRQVPGEYSQLMQTVVLNTNHSLIGNYALSTIVETADNHFLPIGRGDSGGLSISLEQGVLVIRNFVLGGTRIKWQPGEATVDTSRNFIGSIAGFSEDGEGNPITINAKFNGIVSPTGEIGKGSFKEYWSSKKLGTIVVGGSFTMNRN